MSKELIYKCEINQRSMKMAGVKGQVMIVHGVSH